MYIYIYICVYGLTPIYIYLRLCLHIFISAQPLRGLKVKLAAGRRAKGSPERPIHPPPTVLHLAGASQRQLRALPF